MNEIIYLDYAASTPIDPRAVTSMAAFHGAANASSAHAAGKVAADAVEEARVEVAALVGASPGEIVFTSGATEADNLAIGGVLSASAHGHVVTAASEHKAVLETATAWCPQATVVPVEPDGTVDPTRVAAAIRPDTVLVSIMAANNEVGSLSPIYEIGEICRARDVLFHTDAAQAAGKIPLDVRSSAIDLLSLSAHKMFGPKGVGALWVRRGIRHRLKPLMHGGGHERGLRSGTTNVAGCVGFGEAARILREEGERDRAHTEFVRDHLLLAVTASFRGAKVNGSASHRLAGIVNVRLPGIEAESLLLATPSVAASTGSACTSATPAPSHVLLAMGVSRRAAQEAVRFSFGRFTTTKEVDAAIEALTASAEIVRESTAGVPA